MRYLLVFCMLLSGCEKTYDYVKEVKSKISECTDINNDIKEAEELYYAMMTELKLEYKYEIDRFGVRHYNKSPTAKYLERIGSPYVKGLQKQFKEKDCYTYL